MAIKAELIDQRRGFGNSLETIPGEYFYSLGATQSRNGFSFGRIVAPLTPTVGFPAYSDIRHIIFGRGRKISQTVDDTVFVADAGSNNLFQYHSNGDFEYAYKFFGGSDTNTGKYGSGTVNAGGMIVDQKNRLLYCSPQYLGKFDINGTANYTTGTVTMTNGSATVTGAGTGWTADATFQTKAFRIVGENTFYQVSTVNAGAQTLQLASNYTGTSGGSKTYVIYRGWDDDWKDFGSSMTYDSTFTNIPMDTYEDLVIIGRGHTITTLNVLTDTMTSDTAPAFAVPEYGYKCFAIKANATGILIAWNKNGRSILTLWDGYSDRAIAPWIQLEDPIIGLHRSGSGWVVLTTRNIYYTNGYQLELFITDFLGSEVNWNEGGTAENTLSIGNDLWFSLKGASNDYNIRNSGLYRLNLKTKLVEFFGNGVGDLRSYPIKAMCYPALQSGALGNFPRLFMSSGTDFSILGTVEDSSSARTYSYVTNPIGEGENMKTALALRVPISISEWKRAQSASKNFTITAKIASVDDKLFTNTETKSGTHTTTSIQIDDSYSLVAVGDEIEFITGQDAGYIREVSQITGAGTNTATLTFATALPYAPANADTIVISKFKLIETKTFTGLSGVMKEIYFNIQNQPRAKKFMVKLVVTNLNAPIEVRPFLFIYDDSGEIL